MASTRRRAPTLLCLAFLCASGANAETTKIGFWDIQRKGANQQNAQHRPEWYVAARDVGLEYVRILPDAWPTEDQDFLIGNADNFEEINETDLALLTEALDEAHRNGIKVVLAMLSLPGARWRQLNDEEDDARLWKDWEFHRQAFAFWRQLAARLKAHPAIVAYNPLNEPHPERAFGFEAPDEDFARWFMGVEDTPADLNRFNRGIVDAIRSVDTDTPIILDGWFYASPQAFAYNRPVADDRVLYAFHNPGPWQMTTYRVNQGRYAYPDRVPKSWDGPAESWTRERLAQEVLAVEEFADTHNIPANRIIASEFWYDRRLEGAAAYLADLIHIYNLRDWDWAFYAFRGSGAWTGLDYEIPPGHRMGWRYWQAVENGEDTEPLKPRGPNPLWDILRREFTR